MKIKNKKKIKTIQFLGDWGLGIGFGVLVIGDWAPSPLPNPQSPIPNPQSPFYIFNLISFQI